MYQVTDSSTTHGNKTPHGFGTPHRFPHRGSIAGDLLRLVEQLYPTGRVWNMPEGSDLVALHKAFNLSFLRVANAASGIIDSSFPDNENFLDDDATFWEYIYGITTNAALPIEQRRAVLYQRMAFPNNILPRQSFPYIQSQLQQAGFNVFIYENIFYDELGNHFYKTPEDILGLIPGSTEHGGTTQHGGGTQHGAGNFDVIANDLNPENYSTGGNLWPTFFIAGATITQMAFIDKARQIEFRELVLKLKPGHTVGYLFINYV
jgi:hypothetical protein